MQCCGVAQFLCGIPVNKIPYCGVTVISNATVCDVCAFKPSVFGEMKLFAVLRHQQYQHSLHTDRALWMVSVQLCDVFVVRKIVEVMALIALQNIVLHVGIFPVFKGH